MAKKTKASIKKKNRRSQKKYPALDPQYNLKTRQALLDYDYLDKLSEKEMKWLNKFTEEYVNASFPKGRGKKHLHKSQELKRDCYNRNNARNRDILTREQAQGAAVYLEDLKEQETSVRKFFDDEFGDFDETGEDTYTGDD